jgi:peroxiredoxin
MTRLLETICICAVSLTTVCNMGQAAPAASAAKPARKKAPPRIAPVLLSKQEDRLCKVRVGDQMPAISLPLLMGGEKKLGELFGRKATVVVFWKSDRRMTQQQLADVSPDITQPYGKEVSVVGIAVKESNASAEAALKKAGADFPNMLDADGAAFAQVGSETLPRTYLLDPQGKILWFDIEYSLATRRELKDALRVVAGEPVAANAK